MLTIKFKNPEVINNLAIKKIKASKHADSTKIHETALLGIEYDCDVKIDKRHFIFVVDTSSSMLKQDIKSDEGENISRIEAAKSAIYKTIDADRRNMARKGHTATKNRYSIITFDEKAKIVLDGGDVYDATLKHDHNIKINSGTSIYHGMLKIKELESFNRVSMCNTIVILLSDGYSSVINEDNSLLFNSKAIKTIRSRENKSVMMKEGKVVLDERYFDPKEVIKELTQNGECPRIFSMGIGINYDYEYIAGLSKRTNTPITHIKKQSDFTKALDLGLFDTVPVSATIEIQTNNLAPHHEEIVLHSGRKQEIIYSVNKQVLTNLFESSTVQTKIGDNLPKDLSVSINQINEIDKDMTLTHYKQKKYDQLISLGSIKIELMWDIPHTGKFCGDQDCKDERRKLVKEVKDLSGQDKKEKLEISSNISYKKPLSYVPILSNPQIVEELEKEKEDIDPITLELMKKPTSVLVFREEDGYAFVYTYEKETLFNKANLDVTQNTRHELAEAFSKNHIPDLTHISFRAIAPRHDEVRVAEINKKIGKKESAQAQPTGNMESLDYTEQQSTSKNYSFKM